MALALQALGRKERTVAELGEWLRARGVGDGEASGVLERLLAMGALDDERFARRYAEDKRDLAGWGPERIRGALLGRGVAGELVEAALSVEEGAEQVNRAVSLLEHQGADVSSDAARGRALAQLARRGFPLEVAYEAIRLRERSAP